MIHRYFDHTYLINLDSRKDRLEISERVCKEAGVAFERFRAIPGSEMKEFHEYDQKYSEEIRWNRNAAGLVRTTIDILLEAREKRYKSILIMEDDVEFNPVMNSVIHKYMEHIPGDWELFYFGASHVKNYEVLNPYIARLKDANSCHCYAIHERAFDRIIELLMPQNLPLDYALRLNIHPEGKSYCVYPNMAYQFSGISDIAGRYYNTSFIKQY